MATAARAIGLKHPTDVQRHCWPCCLLGRDTVGVAPTGSGKTLAFALPLVEALRKWPSPQPGAPLALVLVPTRELAQQVARATERALAVCGGRVVTLHGGEPHSAQRALLWSDLPPHVVVATPGRLLDLATPGGGGGSAGLGGGVAANPTASASAAAVSLSKVRCVVLDEADKLMLSSELHDQVTKIHGKTHVERQTLLFTATLAHGLQAAAADVVRRPLVVRVAVARQGVDGGGAAAAGGTQSVKAPGGSSGRKLEEWEDEEGEEGEEEGEEGELHAMDGASLSVPLCIRQDVSVCAEHKKPRRLMKLLEKIAKGGSEHAEHADGAEPPTAAAAAVKSLQADKAPTAGKPAGEAAGEADRRVLIFANKIKAVSFIASLLCRHGMRAAPLSSKLSQRERETTLKRFDEGSLRVLVATDVAARGVHIDGLRYVVNWDFGTNLEQYVHRIGRTGRQGRPGTAYSFFSRALRPLAPSAVRLLEAHGQKVDQYLVALADEVEAETRAAAQVGSGGGSCSAHAAAASSVGGTSAAAASDDDDDDDDDDDEQLGSSTVKQAAAAPGDSGGDSDDGEGGAQRWLAKKLVSPITGLAPAFGAGSLAAWAKLGKKAKKDADGEGRERPKKKRKKKASAEEDDE